MTDWGTNHEEHEAREDPHYRSFFVAFVVIVLSTRFCGSGGVVGLAIQTIGHASFMTRPIAVAMRSHSPVSTASCFRPAAVSW